MDFVDGFDDELELEDEPPEEESEDLEVDFAASEPLELVPAELLPEEPLSLGPLSLDPLSLDPLSVDRESVR